MSGIIPTSPKIYHIVHIDKLSSIINDRSLLCDAEIERRNLSGTTIGMGKIKQRRMAELKLETSPNLYVGDCVPFYFCPRSVMLYMFHRGNHPEVNYTGGQGPIIHLEADLNTVVVWANTNKKDWAFTSSNAGSRYFQDYNDLSRLDEISCDVIISDYWNSATDKKQAEFLIEYSFPWSLVQRIGVENAGVLTQVNNSLQSSEHKPTAQVFRNWYY